MKLGEKMRIDLPAVEAAVLAAVPTGKAMFWLAATGITCIMAGFGLAVGVGERAQNIDRIPAVLSTMDSVKAAVNGNTVRIMSVESRLQQDYYETQSAVRRIDCLVELVATGQTIPRDAVERACRGASGNE